jgi:Na+-transporting NADH:ubiquinone oxidoreductase subunit F
MPENHTPLARLNDYSLTGVDSRLAVEKGLANAEWYHSPIPKDKLRELLERKDGPAIRDTVLWFGLLIFFGICGYALWGSWWAIVPFALYGVIYASSSDSRWHESSHGTAFKTDWMNNVLYEIASFMVLRESVVWRWSHTRHHSDTIIVGLDPEIVVQRPANLPKLISNYFNIMALRSYILGVFRHLTGKLSPEELTFIPEAERNSLRTRAWIYLSIYACVIALAISTQSMLPLMFIGLPSFYGAWLMVVYGYTQHAGLAENVLDHRLNTRTVYMNFINRYLYWNMGYHLEHHMFPLVPYHALPKLHEIIKTDTPPASNGLIEAYREIIPTVLRQVKDPTYYIRRPLPTPTTHSAESSTTRAVKSPGKPAVDGWVEVCDRETLQKEDVIRFDTSDATYAIYRTADDRFFATDGICTHGNTHLAEGMVTGTLIECAKHNGRFDIRDGSPQRAPVCVALKTYTVRESEGRLWLDLNSAGGLGVTSPPVTYRFRVVSNDNIATFIKELVLELELDLNSPELVYQPGEYLQFDVPAYPTGTLHQVEVKPPFATIWETQHIFEIATGNPMICRRNYSFASNPAKEREFRFNVRLATPPSDLAVNAGVGSSYLFSLKPDDKVTAIGPFGDFHLRENQHEMVYLGGGAGMAPLRSHISYLLETMQSSRRISYWYGARSKMEIIYQNYFEELSRKHPNFSFHIALSEPLPSDNWESYTGFIHQVLKNEYLDGHQDPKQIDYYLCGPPVMIQAATTMLHSLGVDADQIAYDEF